MARLTLSQRAETLRDTTSASARSVLARTLSSGLLRWRYGAPVADEITLVPQELRSADAGFAAEFAGGQMGLAGILADVGGRSPFDVRPPSEAWASEVNGFGWLRHMAAAEQPEVRLLAQDLVLQWIARNRSGSGVAWDAGVLGRRVMSWLANADLILGETDQQTFDTISRSLGAQLIRLSGTWRSAAAGTPRLVALIGLVTGDLCIGGHMRHLARAERRLGAELSRQILADGGHVSRNPAVLVELLLDLLPLRQCFATIKRPLPRGIEAAMARMMQHLRFMRLGDGGLARFNGVAATPISELATVLAYEASEPPDGLEARASRYVRLERGGVVAVADVGPPPPLSLGGLATASCLSFELSVGSEAVLVNGGRPVPADDKTLAAARSTASHNALVLGDRSSAELVAHRSYQGLGAARPLVMRGTVSATVTRGEIEDVLEASHGGYLEAVRVVHTRRLAVATDGRSISGRDTLAGAKRVVRLARDVAFAIHFHLAPRVLVAAGNAGDAFIALRNGGRWRMSVEGAELSIEPGRHFADPSGIVRTQQIVLRGATYGETKVEWRIERVG